MSDHTTDSDVAEALARYAPMIWEAGRNAGVQDALREHGPDDERERLLWLVMTPHVEENPYAGVPFEFEAHDADREWLDDALCDALMAARHGKSDGMTVETHLEHLIERVRTRDVPPVKSTTRDGAM